MTTKKDDLFGQVFEEFGRTMEKVGATMEKAFSGNYASHSININLSDEALLVECYKRGLIKKKKTQPKPENKGEVVPTSLIKFLMANAHKDNPNRQIYLDAIELIKERDALGKEKYDHSLMTEDGRDHLEDSIEELGDLMQYLWACKMKGIDTTKIKRLIPVLHGILGDY